MEANLTSLEHVFNDSVVEDGHVVLAFGNRYLVEMLERPKAMGSIIIPETAKAQTQGYGIIRGIGINFEKPTLKVGQRVMLNIHMGTALIVQGKQYRIILEEQLLAAMVTVEEGREIVAKQQQKLKN